MKTPGKFAWHNTEPSGIFHLTGPFNGYEYNTKAKLLRTLECVAGLGEDCETDYDRRMLLMAFDIISRVNLKVYQ